VGGDGLEPPTLSV